MKRATLVILAGFCLSHLASPAAASDRHDFKVFQNAVKHGQAAEREKGHGRENRWLKVRIEGHDRGGGRIKVSLPAALIELVLANSDCRRFKVCDDHCGIDLKAVWRALKRSGPHALVEVKDDGAVFKIWLE